MKPLPHPTPSHRQSLADRPRRPRVITAAATLLALFVAGALPAATGCLPLDGDTDGPYDLSAGVRCVVDYPLDYPLHEAVYGALGAPDDCRPQREVWYFKNDGVRKEVTYRGNRHVVEICADTEDPHHGWVVETDGLNFTEEVMFCTSGLTEDGESTVANTCTTNRRSDTRREVFDLVEQGYGSCEEGEVPEAFAEPTWAGCTFGPGPATPEQVMTLTELSNYACLANGGGG